MPLITRAQLGRVASRALPRVVNAIVDHADEVLPRYGIVTPLRLQHFMAQVLVESSYLRRLDEDLSYTAERAHAVWPHVFPTVAAARPYEHRPEALAAAVYGGRMGNRTPEEAFGNRGQGLLDETGHDNLTRLAASLHVTVDQVRPMLTADAWMLECAAAAFVDLGCLPHADRDDVRAVTRAVNGGFNGFAEREAALKLCRRVWTASAVIAPPSPVPRPASAPAPTGVPAVTPNDTARLLEAAEKIAASPQAAALVQRFLAGAAQGVAAAPAAGWLAGKKTYIVAGLGVASTAVTVGLAMEQAGGLTPAGWLAATVALLTSAGFATLRAAMKVHYGELADIMLGVGKSVALQVVQSQAAGQPDSPAAAAEVAMGAVAAELLPH